MSGVALHVMAKAPLPGRVNTRLAPALGRAGCARLARALLRQTLAKCASARIGPVTLWVAGWSGHPAIRDAAEAHAVRVRAQRGRDLGERMAFVVDQSLRAGDRPILVGTDCPGLAVGDLRRAASALGEGADAVIGPARDGGYYLLGLSGPQPSLFSGLDWGGDGVLVATRWRLRGHGVVELPERTDLDRPSDLAGLSPFGVVYGGVLERLDQGGYDR